MNLYNCKFKHVKLQSNEGNVFTGIVEEYTSALDDPDGVENIGITPDGEIGYTIGFSAENIASIEILESAEMTTTSPQLQPA
ncbi:MAG: hypothetical protein FWG65_12180 [Turicibacter sp.]|nr:hypothetical protein [Turicibacter sp.]